MVGGRLTFLKPGTIEQQQSRQRKHHHNQILWKTEWVAVDSNVSQVIQPASLTHSDLLHQFGGSPQVWYHSGARETGISAADLLGDLLRLVQNLLLWLEQDGTCPQLVVLTIGSQTTDYTQHCAGWQQAALWGMARSIRNEHPELQLVCLDTQLANTAIDSHVAESELLWQETAHLGRRLVMSQHQLVHNATSTLPHSADSLSRSLA